MKQLIWGALSTMCAAASLFFLKYWRVSRDRLFIYFSLAFFSMSINWILISTVDPQIELRHYAYIIRLIAFLLIIIGIVDKNSRNGRRP